APPDKPGRGGQACASRPGVPGDRDARAPGRRRATMSLRSAGGGSSSATVERGVGRRPDPGRPRRTSGWVGAFFRAWTAFLAGIGLAAADEPSVPIDFARQVRPILAEHCWRCHGPDRATRKAGLRLDRREAAIALGAIVPGDREAG